MSGGSYDYAYGKINDFADQIEGGKYNTLNSLRRAFVAHLRLVADAAHAIEWVDSGDSSSGDENASILLVVKAPQIADAATARLREALKEATDALKLLVDAKAKP